MNRFLTIALIILMLRPVNADAKDELCAQLNAFEKQVGQSKQHNPVWVDVYWNFDTESIFSIACKNNNPESKDFCSWVPGNVSMEFAGSLPQRILKCYSVKLNPYGYYKFPKRELKFETRQKSTLIIQTSYIPEPEGLPWMRLAIFPKGSKISAPILPNPDPFIDR